MSDPDVWPDVWPEGWPEEGDRNPLQRGYTERGGWGRPPGRHAEPGSAVAAAVLIALGVVGLVVFIALVVWAAP